MHYSVADRPPLLNFVGRPGPRADLRGAQGAPAPSFVRILFFCKRVSDRSSSFVT